MGRKPSSAEAGCHPQFVREPLYTEETLRATRQRLPWCPCTALKGGTLAWYRQRSIADATTVGGSSREARGPPSSDLTLIRHDSNLTYPIPVIHLPVGTPLRHRAAAFDASTSLGRTMRPVGQHFTGAMADASVNVGRATIGPRVPIGDDRAPEYLLSQFPSSISGGEVLHTRSAAAARAMSPLASSSRRARRIRCSSSTMPHVTCEPAESRLRRGVEYVREDRPGLDVARNTGRTSRRGEIVAYTDDDVVLHPCWLERLVTAFDTERSGPSLAWCYRPSSRPNRNGYSSAGGGLVEAFGGGISRLSFTTVFGTTASRPGRLVREPAWLSAARCSTIVGYFDERLDVGAASCSGRLRSSGPHSIHGGTCRYEPSAAAFHFHRRDRNGLRRQLRAYMSGHVAALLVQHERTGERGDLRRPSLAFRATISRRRSSRMCRRTHGSATILNELRGCLRRDRLLFAAQSGPRMLSAGSTARRKVDEPPPRPP